MKNIKALIDKYSRKAIKDSKYILSSKNKSNSNLFKSISYKIEVKEGEYSVKFIMPDYATYVDKGRRPGKQPPLNVIEKWCRRKGINEKYAFPIAKKISEVGTKATNFLNPIYNLQKDVLPALMKEYKKFLIEETKLTNITLKK